MKLSTTALKVLSVFAVGLASCNNQTTEKDRATVESEAASIPTVALTIPNDVKPYFIHKDTANRMISSYLSSIDTTNTDTSSVRSFIVNADAIRAYLQDTSIKELKVMLAHTQEYINAGNGGVPAGYRSGALSIVLAGYNTAGNYVFATGNMVPDRANPCPAICPISGTAANSLLQ